MGMTGLQARPRQLGMGGRAPAAGQMFLFYSTPKWLDSLDLFVALQSLP
jgi:hypothetical protein